MNKNIVKKILIVFSVILILVAWEWKHYYPFVQEMLAFQVDFKSGATEIINTKHSIKFAIKDRCRIKHNFERHLFDESPEWNGELICNSSSNPIGLNIFNSIIINDDYKYKIKRIKDIYKYEFEGTYALSVIDNSLDSEFFIGGYTGNKEIFDQIESTITGY